MPINSIKEFCEILGKENKTEDEINDLKNILS